MAGRRKGGFAFDLFQPLKKGVLLKQGAVHTAFKYRFFVLYPGFFVYYEKESKWRQDLTKGETLDSRIGAIKLIGGTCNTARNPPKGCKFGFTIHAPDPLNKRPVYLINATSKQDRDEWIDAIRRATPTLGGNQNKHESSPKRYSAEEPIRRPLTQQQSSFPPPYSTSSSQPMKYSAPVPPSVEKNRDIGSEFKPTPSRPQDNWNGRPTSPWQPPNTQETRRLQPTPVQPPRPPTRQYPPSASAQPAPTWQAPKPAAVPRVPQAPPHPPPLPQTPPPSKAAFKSKTPAKPFPVEIAAIMDKTERGSPEPRREGDQWIKAIRKSTTNSPWKKEGSPKRAAESRPKPAIPTPTSGSPKRSGYKKKPLPPPPPPEEDPSSVYVNLDDMDGDDGSSSDDDSPQPPPYVPPMSGKPRPPPVTTPVNFEDIVRQLGVSASQRFIEKKGFLYKLGSKGRNWNLRFFVLRPGVFTYAKTAQTKANEVVKLKNLQIYYPGAGERTTNYQFIVHTESTWNKRADWYFAAQTDREMKDWILAFKLAGQNTT